MKEVEYLQKREPTAGLRYSSVAAADVIRKLRGPLIRAGLLFVPGRITAVSERAVTTKSGPAVVVEVRQQFRVVNVDDALDFYEFEASGAGWDSMEKASSKAQTVAHKNAMLKLFMIETGEEDEDDRVQPHGAPEPEQVEYVSGDALAFLRQMVAQAGMDEATVARTFGVEELRQMTVADSQVALARLEQRMNRLQKEGAPAR